MASADVLEPRSDRQAAALGHGIARIHCEIEQCHLELMGIEPHAIQRKGKLGLDRNRGAEGMPEEFHHAADQGRYIDILGLQLLAAGEGQHALRQGDAALGCLGRVVEKQQQSWILAEAFTHEPVTAQDRHQQIVEVMGDTAGQLPDGFHLLRVQQCLARLVERALGLAPLRQIAGDFGESHELA